MGIQAFGFPIGTFACTIFIAIVGTCSIALTDAVTVALSEACVRTPADAGLAAFSGAGVGTLARCTFFSI